MMRAASAALISALNNGAVFQIANCYTLILRGGATYRWTSADLNLTVNGNLFTCSADNSAIQPIIRRGPIRHARGKETQTLEIDLLSGQTVLMAGIPLPLFAHNGGFDGATVLVEWVPMGPGGWGDTSLGSVVIFYGNVAAVTPTTTAVKLEVKSLHEKLTLPMPRTVFQSACANAFGDSNCGKSLAGLTIPNACTGVPTTTTLPNTLIQAAGYFALGTLTMTSGLSAGATRAVSSYAPGSVVLVTPLPTAPAAGDTFTITPGCDKQWSTCQTKYSNSNNYRGCPWVPPPTTSL